MGDTLPLWFFLKSIPGLGNYTFKRLLDAFGSPEAIVNAGKKELLTVQGVSADMANAITAQNIPEAAQKNIDICREHGVRVITMNDPSYPVLLRDLPDPPPYLYCRGEIVEDAACISIVGSRSPTRYGLSMAEQLSRDLAVCGLVIVSGMARGIDTAAHRGAISAGGTTCAVLGSGVAHIYPPENKTLAEDIHNHGAILSEFPVFAKPEPHHFPVRNRIISGMSMGTIVVEAASKSGSLITARLAAEQGREVFAVPGSTQSAKSTGAHGLLKQGAQLVENADDVIEAIAHMLPADRYQAQQAEDPKTSKARPDTANQNQQPRHLPTHTLDKEETRVLKLLEPYPVHIDELARKADMTPGRIAGVLLQLEIKGFVDQEPGKRFLLTKEASIG